MENETTKKVLTFNDVKAPNYQHIYIQKRVKGVIHKDKSKEIPRKDKYRKLEDDE